MTKDGKKSVSELRSYTVVKSNDIIQKARFQLSTQEQKIILYLISKIKPGDREFESYQFDIAEFCNVCGIDIDNGKNYKNLKATIKSLADKSLWVQVDDEHEILFRWINDVDLKKKSGKIEVRFHDKMKPYLLELKNNFTQYELLYILAMKSQYAIRLYELLKSYEYLKRSVIYDIAGLKKLLMAENYEVFNNFKQRVIDKAVIEINNLSDVLISYELIKEGRKYVKVKFHVQQKTDMDVRLETWKRIHEIIEPVQPAIFKAIE